jgi:hypothetical protein
MSGNVLTTDELVATLQRSTLPTILVEGTDDIVIFRWIERLISVTNADILPCGGRTNLFAVYERRAEFAHQKTVFLADKDMWVFSAIPDRYVDIIFTHGYSIENDMYIGSVLESLLEPSEEIEFRRELDLIAEWFAFEVEQHIAGHPAHVDYHPNVIIPPGTGGLSETFLADRKYQPASRRTVDAVRVEYQRTIRGKILFNLLLRFLSAGTRQSKYSKRNLYELCFKLAHDRILIDRLVTQIDAALK